jgi:preprotein translocase subunit SecE
LPETTRSSRATDGFDGEFRECLVFGPQYQEWTSMRMLRKAPPAPVRTTRQSRPAASFSPTDVGKGLVDGVRQFVYDTRSELKKVVWPTRDQTINLTGLVIGVAIAVSAFIGVVDLIFQRLFQMLVGG